MKYGFTGSQHGAPDETIHKVVGGFNLNASDTVVTGACVGVDSQIFWYVFKRFQHVPHIVVVPGNQYKVDHRILHVHDERVRIIYMPSNSSYRDRNERLVAESDAITAFWTGAQRSGTFMTMNIAKRANKLFFVERL